MQLQRPVLAAVQCEGHAAAALFQNKQSSAKGMQLQRSSKTSNRALHRCRAPPMQRWMPQTCHCGTVLGQGSQDTALTSASRASQMTGDAGAGNLCSLWGGAWDPHDPSRLCTVGGNGVQVPTGVHCWAPHGHHVQLLPCALHAPLQPPWNSCCLVHRTAAVSAMQDKGAARLPGAFHACLQRLMSSSASMAEHAGGHSVQVGVSCTSCSSLCGRPPACVIWCQLPDGLMARRKAWLRAAGTEWRAHLASMPSCTSVLEPTTTGGSLTQWPESSLALQGAMPDICRRGTTQILTKPPAMPLCRCGMCAHCSGQQRSRRRTPCLSATSILLDRSPTRLPRRGMTGSCASGTSGDGPAFHAVPAAYITQTGSCLWERLTAV